MNMIEASLEKRSIYIGRRIIADKDPGLAGIIKKKIDWSALNSYKNPELSNNKVLLNDSELKEFRDYIKKINLFLKSFLTYHFALTIKDWADIDANSVVLIDDTENTCYGSFYFFDQVIALSRTTIWSGGNDKVLLNFAHTLLHELIHAQSTHVFTINKKQSSQPAAFQKSAIARQGLYYTNTKTNALDEAVTEILAIQATLEYFKDEDISNKVSISYQNYIQGLTNSLESISKDDNIQSELFAALVLHKFGAIDYQELSAEFAKRNAASALEPLFLMR